MAWRCGCACTWGDGTCNLHGVGIAVRGGAERLWCARRLLNLDTRAIKGRVNSCPEEGRWGEGERQGASLYWRLPCADGQGRRRWPGVACWLGFLGTNASLKKMGFCACLVLLARPANDPANRTPSLFTRGRRNARDSWPVPWRECSSFECC